SFPTRRSSDLRYYSSLFFMKNNKQFLILLFQRFFWIWKSVYLIFNFFTHPKQLTTFLIITKKIRNSNNPQQNTRHNSCILRWFYWNIIQKTYNEKKSYYKTIQQNYFPFHIKISR